MGDFPEPRAELRHRNRFRVAALLPETPLRTLVGTAACRAGAVSIAYREADLTTVANTRIAAAIVEMLRPLTIELARLQAMADRLPHAPILVYSSESVVGVPDRFAGDSATRRFRFASSSSSERAIREDVEWLVRAISRCALAWLVTVLVRDIPLLARGYVAESLWQLAECPLDAKRDVEVAATALGTSRGVMEHRLTKTSLPPPKELADWLTLLLVTFAARGLGSAPGNMATEVGLSWHRWGRLQARLLRSCPAFAVLPASTQFDLVLVAFAETVRGGPQPGGEGPSLGSVAGYL